MTDNVLKADALGGQSAGSRGSHRAAANAGGAVLILPDFCARVAVLEFDSFPTDPKEQLSLVRFRMKRSVPFDVESAAVSFHPTDGEGQGRRSGGGRRSARDRRAIRSAVSRRRACIPGL